MHCAINPLTDDTRHLISYQKQTVMRRLLENMSMNAIPAYIEDPSCFALQYFDDGRNILVGMTNTSYDIAHKITITFNDPAADVANGSYLNEDGRMLPLKDIAEQTGEKQWTITKDLAVFHYFALQIPHKNL